MGGGKSLCSNWKAFYFTEVFTEIQRGKRLKKADHKDGQTPYVSSTSLNNGIDGFIGNDGGVRRFNDCLTLANSGSVGCAFYHQYTFVASDHVTKLKRDGLDKYAYLFLLPIINRLSEKYSFNREINDERIKREKLLLPATDKGEIDFAFMSAFMKDVEHNILNTTLKVFKERLSVNKPEMGGGVKLINAYKWQEFFIEDVATVNNGVRLTKADMQPGSTPFVGASEANNGITMFTGSSNDSMDSNVLGVNYNGSIGYSFYHPYAALFSDDVKRVKWKDFQHNNTYTLLFLSSVICRQAIKFAYGYKFNTRRMARQKILLPVTQDNSLDWQYMENYMRNIESEQILKYLHSIKGKEHA